MKTNNEFTVALFVIALMILICVIIVVAGNSNKNTDPVDLKVYQLGEDQKTYYECSISTEEMLDINKDLAKKTNFNTNNQLPGIKINGNYEIIKMINGEEQIYAFDNKEDKIIFIGNENRIYKLDSKLYEIIIKACNR